MKKILTTASLTLLLASCATLISGSRQDISFDSNEKHTRIFIDGKEVCQTPCIVKIDRENSQVMVQARKDGFEDKTIFINKGPQSDDSAQRRKHRFFNFRPDDGP